jgi:hypothetical protein
MCYRCLQRVPPCGQICMFGWREGNDAENENESDGLWLIMVTDNRPVHESVTLCYSPSLPSSGAYTARSSTRWERREAFPKVVVLMALDAEVAAPSPKGELWLATHSGGEEGRLGEARHRRYRRIKFILRTCL